MKKVMLDSDIAISAGGQTLYELARVGVPTIAISVADNQLGSIRGWQKTGFIEYAGWWEDDFGIRAKNILSQVKDPYIRRVKSEIGRKLVDGKGAKRVCEDVDEVF